MDIFKRPEPMPREITVRWLIAAATCVALVSVIYIGKTPYGGQPQVGKVADRNIYAPVDFSFNAGLDAEKTARLKNEAALSVRDVYDIDPAVYDKSAQNIKALFSALKELKAAGDAGLEDRIAKLKSASKIELSDNDFKALLASPESEKAEAPILGQLEVIFSQGVIPAEDKENLKKQDKPSITVRNISGKTEYGAEVKNLKAASDFQNPSQPLFADSTLADNKLKSVMRAIISATVSANLKSNAVETSRRREEAITGVPAQEKSVDVVQGELIANRGERITPFHLAKFEALRAASVSEQRFALSILGIFFIVIILVIITGLYLKYYEPSIYSNNRHLVLMAAMAVVITAIGKAISLSNGPAYFVPVAIVPILIGLLLGVRPAIIIAMALSILAGLVGGERFDSTLVFIAGSVVGIYTVRAVRKRSELFKAGMVVGVTNAVCVIGLGILNNLESSVIFKDASMFLMNGIAVGIIIVGTLHIFESLFKMTTNISLLELADPNNPLLKELILKAPGTYHHSLIVGNLAESACDAIGANGLLARVGSYYHDIGKVEKSEYFAENQPITESQHDKLAPTMSSLIIINHVKDGLEKAKKAGLNSALMDFIEQHHGTGLIYYFYQRALESVEDLNKLEEEGFRYPGPKPQTKETAIVHLADSVEAASRTLQNPTPANLEELVRRIINNKFIDGQLDECDLTLKDLNIIAVTFTKVLTGVYHTRVQYPNGKE
ncbi:MAG: HDIG domain-containing protein [Candidatus Omnitrophica bacterium]|nr:HDIG domain-containing protein [Candidatus Omnitrophota bacterium]